MDRLIQFWQNLPPQTKQQVIGGILIAGFSCVFTLLIQKILWPLFKRISQKLIDVLYPHLAGQVLNWWAIRRYQASLRNEIEKIINPWVKVIVRDKQHRFNEFYVPPKLQQVPPLSESKNIEIKGEELEFFAHDVLEKYKRMVIVGNPGSGKSTIIKSLALFCLQERLSFRTETRKWWRKLVTTPWQFSRVLPVILELKKFDKLDGKLLLDHIVEQFERHDFPNARLFVERKLKRGEILLLFDGLDEVKENIRSDLIYQLRNFLNCKHYCHCPAIITCRTAAYRYDLDSEVEVTLSVSEFTNKQIYEFLFKWSNYYPSGKGCKNLMGILMGLKIDKNNNKPERHCLLPLVRNPLILTIVTYFYIKNIRLPESPVGFYEQCTSTFLEDWHRIRGVEVNQYPSSLKRSILQNIALYNQAKQKEDCSETEILNRVQEIIRRMGYDRPESAMNILREIVHHSGLIVHRGEIYYFAHLTFQEYFAASAINNLLRNSRILLEGLNSNPNYWREVALFYCGLTDQFSRNEVIRFLLDKGKIEIAAAIVANSMEIEVDLATSVLEALKYQINQHDLKNDKLLMVLAALGSNEELSYSTDAFQFLENLLSTCDDFNDKLRIYRVLARVGNLAAAEILVNALSDPNTRDVAVNALSTLGEAAVAALEQKLQRSLRINDLESVRVCIKAWLAIGSPHFVAVIASKLKSTVDIATRVNVALCLGETLGQWVSSKQSRLLIREDEVKQLRGEKYLDWIWPSSTLPDEPVLIVFNAIINALGAGLQDNSLDYKQKEYRKLLPLFVLIPVAISVKDEIQKDKSNTQSYEREPEKGSLHRFLTKILCVLRREILKKTSKSSKMATLPQHSYTFDPQNVNFLETLPFKEVATGFPTEALRRDWKGLLDHLKTEKQPFKLNVNFCLIGNLLAYILIGIPLLLAIISQTFDTYTLLSTVFLYLSYTYVNWVLGQEERLFLLLLPFSILEAISVGATIWAGILTLMLISAGFLLSVIIRLFPFSPWLTGILYSILISMVEILARFSKTVTIKFPLAPNQQNIWIKWFRSNPKQLDEISALVN